MTQSEFVGTRGVDGCVPKVPRRDFGRKERPQHLGKTKTNHQNKQKKKEADEKVVVERTQEEGIAVIEGCVLTFEWDGDRDVARDGIHVVGVLDLLHLGQVHAVLRVTQPHRLR